MSRLTLSDNALPLGVASKSTLAGPDEVPTTINGSQVTASLASRRYNYVRNSGFWFAQRQNPDALTTYSSLAGTGVRAITADGWAILNENASVQYVRGGFGSGGIGLPQIGNAPQTPNWGEFTKITTAGRFLVSQQLETQDSVVFRGRTARVQFWARALSVPASFRLLLVSDTNNDTPIAPNNNSLASGFGDPTFGPVATVLAPTWAENGDVLSNGVSLGVLEFGLWRRFSATFEVPTTCKSLAFFIVSSSSMPVGSGIALTMASLTIGATPQEWSPLSNEEEIARVQRRYAKSFFTLTAPATGTSPGMVRGAVSTAGATANQPVGVRFPVLMGPSGTFTFVFFNPVNANAFARNTTAATDATATAATNVGDSGFDILFTGLAAWTVGQAIAVQYTCDRDF